MNSLKIHPRVRYSKFKGNTLQKVKTTHTSSRSHEIKHVRYVISNTITFTAVDHSCKEHQKKREGMVDK